MWRAQLLTQGGVDLLLTPTLLCASLQSLHSHKVEQTHMRVPPHGPGPDTGPDTLNYSAVWEKATATSLSIYA